MPLDPFSGLLQTGLGVLSSGIGLFTGLSQKSKAKKMLSGLTYPTETMPQEYLSNQNLAKTRVNQGLPGYGLASQNIQRQQNNALAGAQDRRSGLGLIGSIQQNTNDAYGNLAVANANTRINAEKNLMNVNSQVGAVKRDLFDKNVRGKYNQDYNYAMSLLGAGNQNFTSALDRLGGDAASYFGGYGGGSSYGNFFGNSNKSNSNGYYNNGQYIGE